MKKFFLLVVVLCGLGWQFGFAEGERNIVKLGKDVLIEENMVVDNAVVVGGNLTVNGKVNNDAVSVGGMVFLGPNALVGKNVVSVGGEIQKDETAEIVGNLVEVNIPGLARFRPSTGNCIWKKLFWGFRVLTFIGLLAMALLLVAILPKQIGLISTLIESSLGKSIFWGGVGAISIIPVAVLLTASIVGILFLPIELVLVMLAFLVGYIAVAQLIGKKIFAALKKDGQPMVWEAFLGLVILFMIGFIPILGWFVKLVVGLSGFGGIILTIFKAKQQRN
ncbi:MAG: hypothetical protein ABII74_09755 [Elusimicrobiota bacterium]